MLIEQLVTEKEVMACLNIRSPNTMWRYRKECCFPEPVRSHPNQYRPSEVQNWINNGGSKQKIAS
ncbi:MULTISPECIES: helix-turn-helix transcriptional regulator [Tatumella]|uniref:Helix-turn-helix transcriptional regulator n=1 Tax=Tatumella punctata TaxID=399969 RepID=A0ABW1VRT2_9GAMM|nr:MULTISPECIES: AlpA family transcriptional regulator [unclassified Tatumella]MBS0854757.1 AlpA family transcriptional regulator [Tatumella sp. JGM16]MBS0913846.1 AlpA family transcriptional regulator [Tatumella sp. JGM91]